LHMAGKQIVVTGDEPATKSLLQERIQSRLAGGLEVDIQAPDYESRYAILQSKAPDCDAEVLDKIARLSHQNVRELEGALNRVVAYSQLVGEPVSSEIAEVALKSLVPDGSDDEVTADQVLQAVADYTGVDVEAMMGKKRDKSTSEARRMAMYLLREDAHLTSNRVGKALGGKDHSTVLYAQKRFEQLLETDTSLRGQLSSVRDIMQRSKRTSTISN
jgi:chromosomal replication initiator protein